MQIVKNSTSLNDIWAKIREHYGFQSNVSRFLDIHSIELNVGERYEDLYQRIVSFFDDNLLTAGSITQHGDEIYCDEEISPSLENLIVYMWLSKIHDGLPALIKQRYGSEQGGVRIQGTNRMLTKSKFWVLIIIFTPPPK